MQCDSDPGTRKQAGVRNIQEELHTQPPNSVNCCLPRYITTFISTEVDNVLKRRWTFAICKEQGVNNK